MFITHGPVAPDNPLFVGRSQELARMEQWFHQVRFVGAVLGARQTGKTSLLLKARHHYQAKYQFVFINLEAIFDADEKECFTFIAEEMLDQLGKRKADIETDLPDNSRNFLAFLRTISRAVQSIRIVLLLDEVGALPLDLSIKLAHSIRSVFTSRHVRPEYQRFVFVLAGSTDMLTLTSSVSSPLKNVTDSIYLTDFTFDETQRLLTKGFAQAERSATDSLLKRVYHWSNGHPYLTQLLATQLLSTEETLTPQILDRIVERLWQTEDRNLPHLFRAIAQDNQPFGGIIDPILEGESLPFSRSNSLMAELELIGVIKNENGRCQLRNRFYAEAIRNRRVQDQHLPGSISLEHLRLALIEYFSLDEIRDLCFTLNIDFDALAGQGKANKARELVIYLQHRGRIDELIALGRQQRPHLPLFNHFPNST